MNYKRILKKFMNFYEKEESSNFDITKFYWFEKDDNEIALVISSCWIVFIPREEFPLDLPRINELYKPQVKSFFDFESIPTEFAIDLGVFENKPIKERKKQFHKFSADKDSKKEVVINEKYFKFFSKNSRVTTKGFKSPVYIWEISKEKGYKKKECHLVGVILPIIVRETLFSVEK